MYKKLLIIFAPLLVTTALAMMPAAAQAAPRVYKNGLIGGEGKKVREIFWMTLNQRSSNLGEVECHTVFGGFLENPTGGGGAKGQVQGFYPYECLDATCTTVLGGERIEVAAHKLPWLAEVIEPKAGVFRLKIGHRGPTPRQKPNELTEPEFMDLTYNCVKAENVEFFGENDPLILNNGISIGSGPDELVFTPEEVNPESHDLETEPPAPPYAANAGHAKFEGYGAEELIEAKNP